MWIECTDFENVPEGVWLGTVLETDFENKRSLVKIESWPINGGRIVLVDGISHYDCRDFLQLLAITEPPELFGE